MGKITLKPQKIIENHNLISSTINKMLSLRQTYRHYSFFVWLGRILFDWIPDIRQIYNSGYLANVRYPANYWVSGRIIGYPALKISRISGIWIVSMSSIRQNTRTDIRPNRISGPTLLFCIRDDCGYNQMIFHRYPKAEFRQDLGVQQHTKAQCTHNRYIH